MTPLNGNGNGNGHRHLRLRRRDLPGLWVWCAAVVAVVALYARQERGAVLSGFAQETVAQVAAEAPGRLRDVVVAPDQKVEAGQVVAWLDDTQLKLELAVASAELRRLRSEAERETAAWALDLESDRRRFAADTETSRLDYLGARADLASARVELQGLEATLARSRALAAQALTSQATLEADSTACQAQRELVAGRQEVVTALAERLRQAQARQGRLEGAAGAPSASALPAALAAAVEVQETRLQLAELAQARCALHAPAAGVVGEVLRRPGEVVAAGEPVVTVIGERALEVVAYATEEQSVHVAVGDQVRLRRAVRGSAPIDAVVTSVGAAMSALPLRVEPFAQSTVWGQAIRVRLPEGSDVKPGESFRLSFR